MSVTLIDHPLADHLLSLLRHRDTPPAHFRRLTDHIATLLVLEATRTIRTRPEVVPTPLEPCSCRVLDQGLAVVPVLRAGLAMLPPTLALFPDVAVGYIGLERDEATAQAIPYYRKLPPLEDRFTLCFDPMLATGGSASQALRWLKEEGARRIVFVNVVAAPEGIARLRADHPDVDIVTAAIDRGLDARHFIVPGLGDFGDRLYGTLGKNLEAAPFEGHDAPASPG